MALPRGFGRSMLFQLPPSIRLSLLQQSKPQILRFFNSSCRHLAQSVKPKPKAPPKPSAYVKTPHSVPSKAAPAYQPTAIAAQLSNITEPVLLYKAPKYTSFHLSSYAASAFCLTFGGVYFHNYYLYPPKDWTVHWVVPYGLTASAFVFFGMGVYLMTAPQRLVKTIEALPGTPLKLRIIAGRGIGHFKGKTMEVPASTVYLQQPLDWVTHDRDMIHSREAAQAQALARSKDEAGLLLRPFLVLGDRSRKLWRGMLRNGRNYWSRADFVSVVVEGVGPWKVNWRDGEWMRDRRGLVLGQVLRVR